MMRFLPALPLILLAVGGIITLIGAFTSTKQFAYSWLTTYMFYLSLMLGGLFLVIVHHLFDAAWSVPIRRIAEHMACLLPVMGILFIPIAIMAWVVAAVIVSLNIKLLFDFFTGL